MDVRPWAAGGDGWRVRDSADQNGDIYISPTNEEFYSLKEAFAEPREVTLRMLDLDLKSHVATVHPKDPTLGPYKDTLAFVRTYWGRHGRPITISM